MRDHQRDHLIKGGKPDPEPRVPTTFDHVVNRVLLLSGVITFE